MEKSYRFATSLATAPLAAGTTLTDGTLEVRPDNPQHRA
jgi:hypothetical protein